MGYETKMFIVQRFKSTKDGYCSIIASLDLSKIGGGHLSKLIGEYKEEQKSLLEDKKYYFYDFYGEDECKVFKDKYGDILPLIPIREFYDALEEDIKASKKENGGFAYRRYEVAAGLLKPFFSHGWKDMLNDNELFVLAYGH